MERAEVSRRLKAARWLRGGLDGRQRPAPMSPEVLAQLAPLRRNGITANAISEIERMVKDARPMELREISEALELPANWFTDGTPGLRVEEQLDEVLQRLTRLEDELLAEDVERELEDAAAQAETPPGSSAASEPAPARGAPAR